MTESQLKQLKVGDTIVSDFSGTRPGSLYVVVVGVPREGSDSITKSLHPVAVDCVVVLDEAGHWDLGELVYITSHHAGQWHIVQGE